MWVGGGNEAGHPRFFLRWYFLEAEALTAHPHCWCCNTLPLAVEILPLRPGPPPGPTTPTIPLPAASLDLVLSSLSLHWVNDLPSALREVRRVLRPDGAFLAACLGGETLAELRSAFVAAETERYGGVSPHVSPMMGVADAGNLLAGAGFGIPTADSDTFTIEYPSPIALMEHLQAMGENHHGGAPGREARPADGRHGRVQRHVRQR